MYNKEYWEHRANLRMHTYHKNSDSTVLKLNKAYKDAMESIDKDIDNIYLNFVKNGDMDDITARKLLNSYISNPTKDKIRGILPYIHDDKTKKYLLAKLNSSAYKARITRLEAIKESINIELKKVADIELQDTTSLYINNIKDAYYRNIFDIEKGTGIGINFSKISTNKVEEILRQNWSGDHYSDRIWNNSNMLSENLGDKVEELLLKSTLTGTSIKRLYKELDEFSTFGTFVSERLLRTENTYVCNQAELESYKECEIERYVFVATLDKRTSKQCREHDGKVYLVSEGIPGETLPPLHPYCRSTTIAYFGKDTLKRMKRRARNPETGRNEVVDYTTYREWYKNIVEE